MQLQKSHISNQIISIFLPSDTHATAKTQMSNQQIPIFLLSDTHDTVPM